MGKKIFVNVNCVLEIDEASISSSPEGKESDIQDQIKYAIQRVQNGYDERVSWSIDYYLNDNMPKWLTALKPVEGKIQGIPMVMYEDINGIILNENSDEDDLKAKNKWSETLDTIISGFEAAKEIEENWVQESEDNELWKKFNLGMDTFKKYYFNLWD